MTEDFIITIDVKIDKAMLVRMKDKIIRVQMDNRLHGLDTKMNSKHASEQHHSMFSNDEEEPNNKNVSSNNNMMHYAQEKTKTQETEHRNNVKMLEEKINTIKKTHQKEKEDIQKK